MDGGLTLTWLIVLLVIISLHNSRWVSGTFHENQSSRRKLTAKEGFISIDCGIAPGSYYTDSETEIYYTSDAGFTDTGINYNVSEEYVYQNNDQHLKNVRSFPEGDRNCYTLWPGQGKNHKYLIRARFLYGNYDSKNQLPIFKLYLGVDEWTTVNIRNVTSTYRKEIIHIPITDYIDVCLVNIGSGTPFISVLELKRLNDSIYSPAEPGSLILYDRWDFGTQQEEWKLIREKDDVYDRIWKPNTWWSWLSINSSVVSSSFSTSDYKLPGIVMATAAKPANESESWGISLSIDDDPSQKLYMNLTGNNLTGSVPQAVTDKFKDGTLSLGENPNLCPTVSCQGQKKKKKKNKFFVPVLTSILSAIVILVLIAALAIIRKLTKRRETKATTIETVTERPKEGPLKSGNCEFTYSEVVGITNNFNRPIGRGGFGEVYLGTLADDTQVAVKVHSPSSNQGPKAFRAEAKLLTRVHHKNLVRLIGYCDDSTNMVLIYEYMSNGNLQQKLSAREAADVLNWKQRLQIAVDAAHGLEYLHNGCKPPIVHRDMKSSNILLTESLQAKIADFGMSRDLQSLSTDPVGTPGYFDPECQSTGNLNEKSDVYSFGIVLLELITGRRAIIPGGIHIAGWVSPMIERGDIRSIVDPRLQGDFNTNSAWKAVEIALACVASTGMQRPDMSHVVVDLKECLEREVASRRIQRVGGHSIGSGNFLENVPLVLSTEVAPHAR
uniref:Protein kinase domain-containing protein n=1 Tax=Vitis vinifera TaxID=29760 RepID=A5BTF6_VITVI|nr:hypothetical protein VITISV_007521 [Vitis vinifera]